MPGPSFVSRDRVYFFFSLEIVLLDDRDLDELVPLDDARDLSDVCLRLRSVGRVLNVSGLMTSSMSGSSSNLLGFLPLLLEDRDFDELLDEV